MEDLLDNNYTRPDDESEPIHNLFCMLVFARSLCQILEPNTGIVVELKNDMKKIQPDVTKILVCNKDDQIKMLDWSSMEEEEGDLIIFTKEN